MNTRKPICLTHSFSLSGIANRIAAGERITIREPDVPITRCCPTCGEPILHYPHNTHWSDQKYDERIKASGEYTYTDGDTIFIQEVYDSFHDGTYKYIDLDAQMLVGRCHFCGDDFGLVQVFCFDHIPRPEEGAQGDPGRCMLCDYRYDHMVRSVEESKLYLVCLVEDPIGIMGYGKNILFRADAFAGYPTEDFQTDCCFFALDCICTESQLDASPIGVCCGHYDMNDTRSDWAAAAVISKALYRAAKEHMAQA